tara:strand:+ start:1070 stop:3040 length:1971 start_codon:yes stop_codon:yes gene_type:complete
MSESIVIELRQENDNTKVMSNGDYISTMLENVTLSKGDSLVVRNAFVDTTVNSNQFITLDNDYNISSDFMFYNYSFQTDGIHFIPQFALTNSDQGGQADTNVSLNGRITGLINVLCKPEINAPAGYSDFSTVTFNRNPSASGTDWGDIRFDVVYTDLLGEIRTNHSYFYKQTKGTTFNATILGSGGILAKNGSVTVNVTTANIQKGNITSNFTLNSSAIPGNVKIFHPVYQTLSGTIPKGKYTPTELAEKINSIFQIVPTNPKEIYLEETVTNITTPCLRLLKNSNSYADSTTNEVFVPNTNDDVYIDYFGTFGGGRNQASSVKPGGPKNCYIPAYSYGGNSGTERHPAPIPSFWTGASQVEFFYNQDTNKMSVNYLHTPQYAKASDKTIQGGEVVTIYANDAVYNPAGNGVWSNATRANTFFGKANGGIILSSLTSEPAGFWDDLLGFDVSEMCINPNYQRLTTSLNDQEYFIVTNPTYFPYMDLIEGKNITAPIIINDMNIQKNGTFNQQSSSGGGTSFNVVGTTAIIAPNVLLDNILDTAYYLIEVDSKFKSNVFTSDKGNMRNVQTICNTYFNNGVYTSASSADSIVYTHQGVDDITLQSFGVRILSSNKELAQGIGPDNTVFLEVQRANPPLLPPQILNNQQKKKQNKYMV